MLALALATNAVATLGFGSSGLATSAALTASGPGITCVLGADGRYTVTTSASCTTASFAATPAGTFAGDYLAEIEIITPANGMFCGFDATAFAGSAVMEEAFFPDAGFGAARANYMKSGSFAVTNVAFTGRVYMERVGTVEKFYQGLSWPAALLAGPIITSTAVDAAARLFAIAPNSAGLVAQWIVRAINHP